MLKKKNITVILLALALSLGLSVIALAADGTQTVDANITAYLALTPPDAISGWALASNANPAHGDNQQDTAGNGTYTSNPGVLVTSNTPYQLAIKCDTPSTGTAGYMNKYDNSAYSTTAVTLQEPFYFEFSASDGTTSSPASTWTTVTTTDQTVVYITDAATDDDGFGTTVTYSQPAHFSDQRLGGTATYHIVITYTATATL